MYLLDKFAYIFLRSYISQLFGLGASVSHPSPLFHVFCNINHVLALPRREGVLSPLPLDLLLLGPSYSSSANSSSPSNACERERVRAKMAGRSLREVAEGLMYFLGCVGASMGTRDSGVRPLRVPLATLLHCVDVQVNSSYKLALRM